jgi:Predicted eukaryotic-type DNA primase
MTGSAARLDKSSFNYPDFIVFDLDPYLYSGKEARGAEPELHKKGFQATVKAARLFKDLLDELGLKSFIKTSGKTGLHIFVPIVRNIDYDTVRDIAQKICASILARHSEILTMDWAVKKRPGKVFLDYNMNARGKSLASIFSPRAVAGAFVSMPLDWSDLDEIYPTDFNIWTVPGLLARCGDQWKEILDHKNDLQSSFQRKLKKAV